MDDEQTATQSAACADDRQECQRCGIAGQDRRVLWIDAHGINELAALKIPLRRRSVKDERASGYEMWGLVLCDDCLEDWWGALSYWWIRYPSTRIGEIYPDLGPQPDERWPRAGGPYSATWGDAPAGTVWQSVPGQPARRLTDPADT